MIEKFATTPYGTDDQIDEILSHSILIFNPIQNPDGRVFGMRENGNGFDLNRDFLTQSQSETRASITLMKRWLAPEMLDMHGYVGPTLIEATTKPHNPSIEYDMWLKWNQPRIDYNEAALDAIDQDVTRPINEWCPEADEAGLDGICDDGSTPGPDVAEGWDDWGPFYAPMYHQHVGLDASTVEMCNDTNPAPETYRPCGGRAGARKIQRVVQESTMEFTVAHRDEMLRDELEIYRRGDVDAPRPACCPDPFKPEFHNWMLDYPKAYVIPVGKGQRSDAEANRLIEWALFNDIEVDELERDYRFGSQTFEEGSYVIWMAQPRRGLADTALSVGVDISSRIQRLYAPPAAWSHGYLWGADTVTIPDGAKFSPKTDEIRRPNRLKGSVPSGKVGGLHPAGQLGDRGAGAQRPRARGRQGVDRDRVVQRRPGRHRGVRQRQGHEEGARGRGARLRARLRQARLGRASDPRGDRARAAHPRAECVRQPAGRQHGSVPARRPERLGPAPARLRRRSDHGRAPEHGGDRPARRLRPALQRHDGLSGQQRGQPDLARAARRVLHGRRRLHRRPAQRRELPGRPAARSPA